MCVVEKMQATGPESEVLRGLPLDAPLSHTKILQHPVPSQLTAKGQRSLNPILDGVIHETNLGEDTRAYSSILQISGGRLQALGWLKAARFTTRQITVKLTRHMAAWYATRFGEHFHCLVEYMEARELGEAAHRGNLRSAANAPHHCATLQDLRTLTTATEQKMEGFQSELGASL